MGKKKKAVNSRPVATSSTKRAPVIILDEEETQSSTIDTETPISEQFPEILDEVDNERVIKLQVDLVFSSPPASCKSPFSVVLDGAIEYSLIQAAKSSATTKDYSDVKPITVSALSTIFLSLEVFLDLVNACRKWGFRTNRFKGS
jgi:hypothetical protein